MEQYRFFGKTDIGKKRKTNQDSFFVGAIGQEGESIQNAPLLAVVCDGMGGANGGNVASELAINIFTHVVDQAFASRTRGQDGAAPSYDAILLDAVYKANRELYDRSERDPLLSGMGTTLVACLMTQDGIYAINVGDSRLYVQNVDAFDQVTRDHSYVQALVDSGQITNEQAKNHPNKNIIMRALGINEDIEADFFFLPLSTSKILLCSDGLSGYLEENDLKEIVLANNKLEEKVERLVQKANDNGGGDNITVILIESDRGETHSAS